MEFSILYAIPHTAVLGSFFLAVTNIAGSYGQLWVIVAAVLLIFKSTRKAGVAVLFAYAAVFLIGQYGLKNLISRPRPCQIDLDFTLLVSRPSSSSFPSTHSAWAFGAATAIFMQHKKAGVAAFIYRCADCFQPPVSVSAFSYGCSDRHRVGYRAGRAGELDHRAYLENSG